MIDANCCTSYVQSDDNPGSCCGVSQITQWMGSGTRTSFSQEDQGFATCQHHPLLCPLWAQTTEGQAALLPQKQPPATCQVRKTPLPKWRKTNHTDYVDITCLYPLSFSLVVGNSRRQDVIGGVHTSEVIMRKRSENRGYTDENIRDSIVMGDVPSKFPDLGKLQTSVVVRIYSKVNVKGIRFVFLVWEGFNVGVRHSRCLGR